MNTAQRSQTPQKSQTLHIRGLRVSLPGTARPVLDGVDLEVGAGQTVALVGESGSGKTLTSRAALGMLPAGATASGVVEVDGQDVLTMDARALRRLRTTTAAMIFQDPRAGINPVRRVGDFLTEALRTNGAADKRTARKRALALLDAVGLPERVLRQYPHELSGGMLQRVMIAASLMADPVLLLADEPTTALDVTTQAEIIALLRDLQSRFGTALLFVTHDLELAAVIADRVAVMYAGRIVETGPAEQVFADPKHPYTAALLAATPRLDAPAGRLAVIPGRVPDLRTEIAGCAFAGRCAHAVDACGQERPETAAVPDRSQATVACWRSSTLTLQGGASRG
ncbi:ABC transporter ATP-binding protein [Catenulispora sp. NL8]|uniref:ABC transporter ATP-binding protein n=1 Tax=Catenulispora pinistramenti TaxID=2705254 RepID=A0ABS5L5Y2_9ACTN|nr:ABC transporter ATP-binding protein [Catenulispora pinistramenti]MBS2553745.1 ABC transporter ATP-binding protein [Catenulispora pinistramenti]